MISIVIPNYNSSHLLAKNIPKLTDLLAKSKLDYEIIISDDASTESLEALQKFPVKMVHGETNVGFGRNVDRGIRAASGDIVFILNAIDILPQKPDYFSLLLEHFKNKDVFSVAAVKRDEEDHGKGQIYFEKGFFLHKKGNFKRSISAWADGGAQALRKEYYFQIGGFDPLYKFYWEDVDLGFRAWKTGYKIIFEPKAVLSHQKAEGPIAKRYSTKELRLMNLYGQFIFTWKNADFSHLLKYFLWEPYHLAVALKNRDGDFFRAYCQALIKWPEICLARIKQKGITKLSDKKCLSLLS